MQAALLDEIDVSVIVTDLELTVLSWNAGAERLYGWTAEEAVGRPASGTILPARIDPPSRSGTARCAVSGRPLGRSTRCIARTARGSPLMFAIE